MSEAVPHERRLARVRAAFGRTFGHAPEGVTEAPGRVNLIGEHVDYNDGLVLPFAIERSVLVAWSRREDDAVWAHASDLDEEQRFNLSRVTHAAPGSWSEYVRGVFDALIGAGMRPPAGMELSIAGDVPRGAGLSSSAALEVAIMGAARDAYALPLDGATLAQLCQRAENAWVGVQSGIMDQYASALSRAGHALLIDCRTLTTAPVPLPLMERGIAAVIAESGVRRDLVSSAYNQRRAECADALARIRGATDRPLASLRDATQEDLAALDGTLLRRARHVVGEIRRVEAAINALAAADFTTLGRLMGESHASLRDDYEVSSEALDALVGLAMAQPYTLGARLTGAGFGGCTVNLVRADAVADFARDVIARYRARTGLPGAAFATAAADGLRRVE
ncbi:MAG: galactokinase [Chloroflexi bacterium]|nr:galactokinase [Chloroflexota bacterium]